MPSNLFLRFRKFDNFKALRRVGTTVTVIPYLWNPWEPYSRPLRSPDSPRPAPCTDPWSRSSCCGGGSTPCPRSTRCWTDTAPSCWLWQSWSRPSRDSRCIGSNHSRDPDHDSPSRQHTLQKELFSLDWDFEFLRWQGRQGLRGGLSISRCQTFWRVRRVLLLFCEMSWVFKRCGWSSQSSVS